MKKNGLRIALALVLALTMVLGSASVAAAKGNPHSSVTVTTTADWDGAAYDLGFTLEWNALRIQRVLYSWYSWNGTDWVWWGKQGVNTFIKPSRSGFRTYDSASWNPQDVSEGEQWKVVVAVMKPKGQQYVYAWETLEEEVVWV